MPSSRPFEPLPGVIAKCLDATILKEAVAFCGRSGKRQAVEMRLLPDRPVKGLAHCVQPSAREGACRWPTTPSSSRRWREEKTLKVIEMDLNHMQLKMQPKHCHNTEQTLNHEWIFGKAQDLRKQNGAVHSGRRHATLSLCGLMT
jgi:hypothetical protein